MGKRTGYITVDVDVHIDEVMGSISNEMILEEVKLRDLRNKIADGVDRELAVEALYELRRGCVIEAIICLERALFPKWKTQDAAFDALKKFTSAEAPQ